MTVATQAAQNPEEHVPDFELRCYNTAPHLMEGWLRQNIGRHLKGCNMCEERRVKLLDQPPVTGKEAYWRMHSEAPLEERMAELKKLGFDE